MKLSSHRGFTLVELLVVIAIIAILSVSVSTLFTGTREQARDARIKSSLSSARTEAEQIYGTSFPNTYVPICFETMVGLANTYLGADGTVQEYQCLSSQDAWVAIFPLYRGGYWCSDGKGRSMAVEGFVPYSAAQYMDCLQATAEDNETQSPPPEEIDPEGTGSDDVPTITLDGSGTVEIYSPSNNPFQGNAWHKYHEPGYSASDNTDGDITDSIVVEGPVLVGSNTEVSCREYYYELYYSVTNSGGISASPQTRDITHFRCQEP